MKDAFDGPPLVPEERLLDVGAACRWAYRLRRMSQARLTSFIRYAPGIEVPAVARLRIAAAGPVRRPSRVPSAKPLS